LAFWWADYSLL